MKVGELIDMRKKKMVWKSTVAAGKQPTTNLDIIGVRIGQTQSTGDTSKPRMSEAVGFRLGSKDHAESYAKQKVNGGLKTEIRVSELLRRVKLSTMSQRDEQEISDALMGHRPTDVLKNRDLEQIAAIANVDLSELRDLAGFY